LLAASVRRLRSEAPSPDNPVHLVYNPLVFNHVFGGIALLAIRLTRQGAKKKPFYRVIVAEKRSKRDGRFIEIVGYYNPCREPVELKLNHDRISYWMQCGAQPSETVRSLIRKSELQQPASVEVGN